MAVNGPQMNPDFIKAPARSNFARIHELLKKQFEKIFKNNSVFFSIGTEFFIYPNAIVRDLFNNFQIDGELIIRYQINEPFG